MIDKCPRCNVKVDSNLSNCPLCGSYIEREEQTDIVKDGINYGYPKVGKSLVVREIAFRVVLYACLISIGISFLVNFLAANEIFWAYHVLFGWGIFWCTIGRSLFFHLDMRKQIFWYSVFASVICYYIQTMIYGTFEVTEAQNWALVWATPAFLLGGIAVLFVYMLIEYKDWVRLAMPLTAMCLVTAIPAIISGAFYDLYLPCSGCDYIVVVDDFRERKILFGTKKEILFISFKRSVYEKTYLYNIHSGIIDFGKCLHCFCR